MPSPLISFFTSLGSRRVVETVTPERTLADVVLPPQTRRALEQALAQVRNHSLIFHRWGLGERHASGRGLAFNFAGPPGTGKTLCAEAIAHALGIKLLVVDYAEAESMWFGQTPKKTPLAPDVDFQRLAEQYVVSEGDIKNAVIKAAAAAAAEPGPDLGKRICQRHFERATEEVLSAKVIMQQSLFAEGGIAAPDPLTVWRKVEARWRIAILVALGLAGAAFVAALVAVALVLLR